MPDDHRTRLYWLAGVAIGAHLALQAIIILQLGGIHGQLIDIETSINVAARNIDQLGRRLQR